MVLSVKDGVIQTTNAAYTLDDVIVVFKESEEMRDPYTDEVIGHEEEVVTEVVVFEINTKTGIVKAAAVPSTPFAKAKIEKGMGVRAKVQQKKGKDIPVNQKSALKKLQKALIIK